jgi:hypothetical protein
LICKHFGAAQIAFKARAQLPCRYTEHIKRRGAEACIVTSKKNGLAGNLGIANAYLPLNGRQIANLISNRIRYIGSTRTQLVIIRTGYR